MDEYKSVKTTKLYPNLDNQQFKLDNISKLKDYFISDIKERELMSKNLSKYVVSLNILVNL